MLPDTHVQVFQVTSYEADLSVPNSDLYGVGCLVYELAVGKHLHAAVRHETYDRQLQHVSVFTNEIAKVFMLLCCWMVVFSLSCFVQLCAVTVSLCGLLLSIHL